MCKKTKTREIFFFEFSSYSRPKNIAVIALSFKIISQNQRQYFKMANVMPSKIRLLCAVINNPWRFDLIRKTNPNIYLSKLSAL